MLCFYEPGWGCWEAESPWPTGQNVFGQHSGKHDGAGYRQKNAVQWVSLLLLELHRCLNSDKNQPGLYRKRTMEIGILKDWLLWRRSCIFASGKRLDCLNMSLKTLHCCATCVHKMPFSEMGLSLNTDLIPGRTEELKYHVERQLTMIVQLRRQKTQCYNSPGQCKTARFLAASDPC